MCVRSTYTLVYLSMQLERQTSWPLTPGKAECVVLSVTQHLINTEGARQFAFEHFATYQESCDRFCDCCARARQIRYSFRYLHPTNKSILSYSDTQCTFSNLLISISQFKWRKECLCSTYTFHYCRSSAWWFVRQTRGNQHCEPLVFRCRSTNWLSGLLCCWREELIPTQKAHCMLWYGRGVSDYAAQKQVLTDARTRGRLTSLWTFMIIPTVLYCLKGN